jgi:hypothetical protein
VVAGEDGHDRPDRDRGRTDPSDRCQAFTEDFQPTERPCGLGQAVLTVTGGLGRIEISGDETPEGVGERAQWEGSTGKRSGSAPAPTVADGGAEISEGAVTTADVETFAWAGAEPDA